MKISATYIPAPVVNPPPGEVRLTMSDDAANKLRALLGKCNGGVFDNMYTALDIALDHPQAPKRLFLNHVSSPSGCNTAIDLHTSYKFEKEHTY